MKDWLDIETKWQDLIELAKNRCVFGEELDTELFKECMKDAFEAFSVGKGKRESFNCMEVRLLNMIYGYSCVPAVTDSEYSDEFEASTHAAAELAEAIMFPGSYCYEDSKMICDFMLDGGFKSVAYDFETGDLSDYIELVKMHYWDW